MYKVNYSFDRHQPFLLFRDEAMLRYHIQPSPAYPVNHNMHCEVTGINSGFQVRWIESNQEIIL